MKKFIQYTMFVPFSIGIVLSELILIPFMILRNYTPIYYQSQFEFFKRILQKHLEKNPFLPKEVYEKACEYFVIVWLFVSVIQPFYRFFINLNDRTQLFFSPEFLEK